MKWFKRYRPNYAETNRREDVLLGLLVALLLFILPLSLYLFSDTPYEFIIPIVVIALFVVMVLQHREAVKEDKARGICKGRNRVWSIYLSGALLCFVGIYLISSRWESISFTDALNWAWILFAIFFVYRGGICIRAGVEYNRTIDRLEEYETELRRLGYEMDTLGRLSGRPSEEDSETLD